MEYYFMCPFKEWRLVPCRRGGFKTWQVANYFYNFLMYMY